jgi:hypothetical protein
MTSHPVPSLDQIARAACSAVLESFRPDSCIATTRVVISVLRYYGLPAKPLAVKVAAFNAVAWPLADAGMPVDAWPREAHSVVSAPGRRGRAAGTVIL